MRTADAEKFYGTRYKIAQVLGITRQAVYAWSDLVPADKAIQLAIDSGGALEIKPQLYKKRTKELQKARKDGQA